MARRFWAVIYDRVSEDEFIPVWEGEVESEYEVDDIIADFSFNGIPYVELDELEDDCTEIQDYIEEDVGDSKGRIELDDIEF
jgi:hypothetical protein